MNRKLCAYIYIHLIQKRNGTQLVGMSSSSRFSSGSRSYNNNSIDVEELIRTSKMAGNVSFSFRVGHVTQIYHCSSPQRYAHPYHTALAISMPLLISLLQLKYADTDHNPFEVHPTATWTSLVSFLISMLAYCYAFAVASNQINPSVPIRVSTIFGFLSVFSLTISFLPSMFWWIIYAMWACSAAFLFAGLFQSVYLWFCRKLAAMFLQFRRIIQQSDLQSISTTITTFSPQLGTSSSHLPV